MQSQYVKFILLLLPLLLTSCTDGNKKDALPEIKQAQLSKINTYASQVQEAIGTQFPYINSYHGKTCTIRLSLQQDGHINDAKVEKGDPEFCAAALAAVSRAHIPSAPDEKTWLLFRNTPLDFAP